jgi:hypothetical protein
VFVEHPPENLMASFYFTSTVLDECTTFIFDFWICIANGSGGFNSHLANSRESETPTATQHNNIDDENLDEMLLLDLAREIEEDSAVDVTSTRAAPGLLGLDSIRSGEERS